MTVLLAILTFLVILFILWMQKERQHVPCEAKLKKLQIQPERPLVPEGYCFHPSHTWLLDEGAGKVRVGVDGFIVQLFGEIDHIEVARRHRWIRQGQKLMTVCRGGISVDLLSPAEGAVKDVNEAARLDLGLVTRDPYVRGWILRLESTDTATDQKNLLQGNIAKIWMHNTFACLGEVLSRLAPQFVQSVGTPPKGALAMVSPEMQTRLVSEFLVTRAL